MERMYILISLLFFIACKADTKLYKPQPAWDDKLDFDSIERQLKTEPIEKLTSMKDYLKKKGKKVFYAHKVYVATLKNGLKAVFKPEDKLFRSYGEVAAYRASNWLGHRLVPPTVLKEHQGMHGSLQFFIETPFDLLKSKDKEKAFRRLSPKVKSDAKLFYFVFGQPDNHTGNQLIAFDSKGHAHLALIDNADIIIKNKSEHSRESISKLQPSKKNSTRTVRKIKELKFTYPEVYSRATMNRYGQLTRRIVCWMFEDALKNKVSYCNSGLFKKIMKRRDHILQIPDKKFIP